MTHRFCRRLPLLLLFLSPLLAVASPLLLDIGPATSFTSRAAGSGPGQGIVVSTTTNLTGIALDADMPSGGQLNFFIFDGSNSNLLFSQIDTVAASSTPSWLQTSAFSFSLNAGSTYYIGATASNSINIGYLRGGAFNGNGLSAIPNANENYGGFSNPAYLSNNPGGADVALMLYGNQGQSQTPEPGTLLLLGTALTALPFILTIAPHLRSYRKQHDI